MIINDRKKAVSVILAKMKPDGSESMGEVKPEVSGPDDAMGDLKSIAEDVMLAVKNGSAHDLAMALKAFCSVCDQYEEE